MLGCPGYSRHMLPIIHRVNTIADLKTLPADVGVEIDVRPYADQLILNHEAFETGELVEDYFAALAERKQAFVIVDMKAEWVCDKVLALLEKYGIENYFLLGVTIPETVALLKKGVRKIAPRFSECEPIQGILALADQVDWVWVDVFTKLPLDTQSYKQLKEKGLKICLVCPERWGRPQDIVAYKEQMRRDGVEIDAIMTARTYVDQWLS